MTPHEALVLRRCLILVIFMAGSGAYAAASEGGWFGVFGLLFCLAAGAIAYLVMFEIRVTEKEE